jgi:hypothetical protein
LEKCLNKKPHQRFNRLIKTEYETKYRGDYINKWKTIVSAKVLKKALLKHFSYLADSPGYTKVLKSIIQKVKQARIVKNALEIKFMGGDVMSCHAPSTKSSLNSYPVSFQKIVSQHEITVVKEKMLLGDDRGVEAYFDETLIGFNKLGRVKTLAAISRLHSKCYMITRNWEDITSPGCAKKLGLGIVSSFHETPDHQCNLKQKIGAIQLQ